MLLPHRLYRRFWHRLLHDHTGDEIAAAVTKLEHANVTMVPFQMGEPAPRRRSRSGVDAVRHAARRRLTVDARSARCDWRTRARIRGHVRSMRVQPWGDVASLECVVVDETGGILLVFLGRRKVAGIELGRELVAEGMVGQSRGLPRDAQP